MKTIKQIEEEHKTHDWTKCTCYKDKLYTKEEVKKIVQEKVKDTLELMNEEHNRELFILKRELKEQTYNFMSFQGYKNSDIELAQKEIINTVFNKYLNSNDSKTMDSQETDSEKVLGTNNYNSNSESEKYTCECGLTFKTRKEYDEHNFDY